MGNHVMPPQQRQDLDAHLARADRKVYLVVDANEEGDAWKCTKRALGDYAASEQYLATNEGDVSDLTNRNGKIGWPEGTDWEGGTPKSICFGWKQEPVFYLNIIQATDRNTVKAAYKRARDKTKEGGGA